MLNEIVEDAKSGMEKQIYHQDCGLTVFYNNDEPHYIGEFSSKFISQDIILDRVKPSGIAMIAKDGFSFESQHDLTKLFDKTLSP